jgi:hypothetical protein
MTRPDSEEEGHDAQTETETLNPTNIKVMKESRERGGGGGGAKEEEEEASSYRD